MPNESAPNKMEQLYQQRLNRYVTAMRNEKPDMVPIRPFVAEFTAKYAGYTCQEVTHDYEKAFAAARKCAADFDWDAVVGNMVYVWTGLAKAIGLRYYGVPGIDIPPDAAFQYLEPPEDEAFMRADEYDALIDDPTGFLFNVWLPRVAGDVAPIGEPSTYRNNLSFLKGGMAMLSYFNGFGRQAELLRSESGTVSAIAGILKAPFDILADKLRGYIGLCMDMYRQPEKVLAACEALMPHLLHVALSGADPAKNVPDRPLDAPRLRAVPLPGAVRVVLLADAEADHRGALDERAPDPLLRRRRLEPAPEVLRRAARPEHRLPRGPGRHLRGPPKPWGTSSASAAASPTTCWPSASPSEVRACCKKVIDGVARDGGYIMDASAIMQDDTKAENLRAMTEATREYGVY